MASRKRTRVVDRGWQEILRTTARLSGTRIVVGVAEDATYPDGTPVALVGAAHEFGVPGRVPQRPWLTAAFDTAGNIIKRRSVQIAKANTSSRTTAALRALASELEAHTLKTFDSLSTPALKADTVRAKGSAKLLYDSGRLRESIKAWVDTTGGA